MSLSGNEKRIYDGMVDLKYEREGIKYFDDYYNKNFDNLKLEYENETSAEYGLQECFNFEDFEDFAYYEWKTINVVRERKYHLLKENTY